MKLCIAALLLFTLAVPGNCAPATVNGLPPLVFAGGVAGSSALADPANSAEFRAAGGGLYLHNNGWGLLSNDEKAKVLRTFQGRPIMLELGFNNGWGTLLKNNYLKWGMQPKFIAANAFAGNNHPTAAGWASYTKALRDAGAPVSTLILPTFEYQNFRSNRTTLAGNQVSQVKVFQDIITEAGGIVLDTPSGYFFGREPAYQAWVLDAIHWARARKMQVVVLVSPHSSALNWGADASRFLAYLQQHDAMPTAFGVENYTAHAAPTYPNVVGTETNPNNTLGVALTLVHTLYPGTVRK